MPISRLYFLLTLLIASPLLSGCSITHALRVKDHTVVDIKTMVDEVSGVAVVFVGELHDESFHHKVQLDIIKGLKAKGKSLAIGMEMFEISSQKILNAWSAGAFPVYTFIGVYQRDWRNLPYSLYEDIFDYARDNRIPIIALNAPRQIIEKVSRGGVSSLTGDDKRLLPVSADIEVSDAYLGFMRSSYPAHGGDTEHFRHICEAQLLRNKVMANRIIAYHKVHPESVIVVITGGGHARGRGGVPDELGNLPFRIILPTVPGINERSIDIKDADYLLEEPFSVINMFM